MSFRRAVSALLLAAYLPACTSFQATSQPLTELTAPPKPVDKVRVTTTAGAQLEVDAPRVVNDTLFGSSWTAEAGGKQTTEAVALPLADIRTVEVKKSDGTTTLLVIVGIVAVVVLLGVAAHNTTPETIPLPPLDSRR
jgi:hypothetical protein